LTISSGPASDPQAAADKDQIVSELAQEWAAITDLLGQLDAAAWSAPALPGWNVHDVVAHLVGTERMLAGAQLPPLPAGAQAAEHVRNDIGRANEAWVSSLRELSNAELLSEFRDATAQRLGALAAMSVADFCAPSWTPAGEGTYGRWMQIRIFDCWMHEQDIRMAVGLPGNEDGPAAQRSLDEVVGALGYIIGKRGRAPDGSAILISLTGPIERELRVLTAGRAKVVP
jgi:uncharacterized protein (TIGR03083 family)